MVRQLPAGWDAIREAGVDRVNTDHLPKLRAFLLSDPLPPP
ncbi:MAG: hypothetical protein ABFD16_27310 [Thermoguttaceae bacterium]|jgi:hypothetical protein